MRPRKILIDTDVVLNVLLKEEPFFACSEKVFETLAQGEVQGCVTATTITNIYYIARKRTNRDTAMLCVGMILETEGLEILSVNRYVIENAYRAKWRDFEDSIQAVVAEEAEVDLIVTRNLRDFKNSPLQAVSPEKLLEILETKDK